MQKWLITCFKLTPFLNPLWNNVELFLWNNENLYLTNTLSYEMLRKTNILHSVHLLVVDTCMLTTYFKYRKLFTALIQLPTNLCCTQHTLYVLHCRTSNVLLVTNTLYFTLIALFLHTMPTNPTPSNVP